MMDLPPGWVKARIGEVAEVNPRPSIEAGDNELVSFVPMAAVEPETGMLDPSRTDRYGDLKRKSYRQFEEGDVVVAKITPSMENGKAALARGLIGRQAFGSTELHVLRTVDEFEPRYLLHYVLQRCFRADAARHMTGTAGQLRVPASYLRTAPLPLPPAAEQRRIVEAIEEQWSRIEAGVESLERAQRNLARLRASTIAAALAPAGVEDNRNSVGAPHAEGWFGATVGEVLAEPLANGRSVRGADDDDGFPVLRLTAIRNGEIDLSQRKLGAWTASDAAPFLVQSGDFFISRGSGSLHLVGRCGLVVGLPDPVAFPDLLIRLRPDESVLDRRFLRALWESPVTRRQIEQAARTTAGIYKINQKDIRNFVIRFPPLDEQRRIVAELDRNLSALEAVQQVVEGGLKQADTLRRAILREAFAGRLVPQNPTDEPASALIERIRTERARR